MVGSGLAALVFAGVGTAWVALNERFMPWWARRRSVRIWNWTVLAIVGAAGLIAVLVGLFMLATGTTFS